VSDNSRAYNSVWQLRSDAWCRLEEASDRLTRPTTGGELKEECVTICKDLLATLTPLEPYWAYPGTPQFSRVQRLFSGGSYDKFAQAVARINRALTTESYRTGDVDRAGLDDTDMFPADPRTLEQQPVSQREKPYFEVLVVEKMTEARSAAAQRGPRLAASRR
jgi:arginine decarboxylase